MPVFETVLLKDVCNFEKGSTGLAKAIPGEYPLVATGAVRRSCESFQFDTNAVCIPLVSSTGHGHASLKNVHYQEGKFALGTILVALTAKDENVLNIQFLHLYLSQLKDVILVPLMSGAANVALSVGKIKTIEIPLPSIGRQKDIVFQFKRIVAEENEIKKELTHQQTLLKKLRQQILQEAIEGKLTADWRAQNPDVEPASELLARIEAEKAQLIQEKKIKKQKSLPLISEEEKPFMLPEGWEWCRFSDVFEFIDYRGKTPIKTDSGFRLITAKNIRNGYIDNNPVEFISEELYKTWMTRGFPKNGDLLFVTEGHTMGFVAMVDLDFKFALAQRTIDLKPFCSEYANWVFYFIMSPFFQETIKLNATGAAATGIKSSRLKTLMIPFPSVLEQKAIVAKVKKLLSLCDRLEIQISQNQTHAEQLMQAVLKEAFSQNSQQPEPVAANG